MLSSIQTTRVCTEEEEIVKMQECGGKVEIDYLRNGRRRCEEEDELHSLELESTDSAIPPRRSFGTDELFSTMNALEILRETIRILRYNSTAFMLIAALLICPLSALLLSNVLVDHSILKRLTVRLLLVARSCGLPLSPFVKHSAQRFSEMLISSLFCFPFYLTLSLLSKAAIVYAVDCTYARKHFHLSKFFAAIATIWRRLISTYLWICMVIAGCLALFLVLLVAVCNVFSILGLSSDLVIYPGMFVGLIFSIIFANAIIICNLAVVITILENVSGPQALLRSSILIQGQTQVGLLIFLGSTIGMTFVEGLFEHRVKTLSYGDGSSRLWEGPLLVLMYSFVVLIDSMMNAVFYFTCRSSNLEVPELDSEITEDGAALSSGS